MQEPLFALQMKQITKTINYTKFFSQMVILIVKSDRWVLSIYSQFLLTLILNSHDFELSFTICFVQNIMGSDKVHIF